MFKCFHGGKKKDENLVVRTLWFQWPREVLETEVGMYPFYFLVNLLLFKFFIKLLLIHLDIIQLQLNYSPFSHSLSSRMRHLCPKLAFYLKDIILSTVSFILNFKKWTLNSGRLERQLEMSGNNIFNGRPKRWQGKSSMHDYKTASLCYLTPGGRYTSV